MIKNIVQRVRGALYFPLEILAKGGANAGTLKAVAALTLWVDKPFRRFIVRGSYEV